MNVDAILCEDTRTSARLLQVNGIKARMIPLHDHNEEASIERLIAAMQGGARYALISDAGTPLVSDPGYRLVRAAIAAGLEIGAVPGPNAAVMAVTLSGLPPQPFLFIGFLAPKAGPRLAALGRLANAEAAGLTATLVFYEGPSRLAEALADLALELGPRPAAIARELTKFYEEVLRGDLGELAAHYETTEARGEIVVVVGPPAPAAAPDAASLDAEILAALEALSVKDAAAAVAASLHLPRREVYARALRLAGTRK